MYLPCQVLESYNRTIEFCDDAYITHNGAEDCQAECTKVECCLHDESDPRSCPQQNFVCDLSTVCYTLLSVREPVGLSDDCQPDVVSASDAALRVCQEQCSVATCCFHNEASCTVPVDCSDYREPCGFLYPPGWTPPVTYPTTAPTTPVDEIIVAASCDLGALQAPLGREDCTLTCREGSCCFRPDNDPLSCVDDVAYCSAFASCLNLLPTGTSTIGRGVGRMGDSNTAIMALLLDNDEDVDTNHDDGDHDGLDTDMDTTNVTVPSDPTAAEMALFLLGRCDLATTTDAMTSTVLTRCFETCDVLSCCSKTDDPCLLHQDGNDVDDNDRADGDLCEAVGRICSEMMEIL